MMHGVFSIFEGDKSHQKKSTQCSVDECVKSQKISQFKHYRYRKFSSFSVSGVFILKYFNKLVLTVRGAYGSSGKIVSSVVQAVQTYQV